MVNKRDDFGKASSDVLVIEIAIFEIAFFDVGSFLLNGCIYCACLNQGTLWKR